MINFRGGILFACSTLVIGYLAAPPVAEAALGSPVLYSQLDQATGEGLVSTNFEPLADDFDALAADDFFVSSPDGWTIESLEIGGFFAAGAGPAGSVAVRFYENAVAEDLSEAPGEVVCLLSSLPPESNGGDVSGNFLIDLKVPCALPSGKHWVSVQANMDSSYGVYRMGGRTVTSGSEGMWKNERDGSRLGCGDWTPMSECGQGAGADFLFELHGFESAFFEDSFEEGDLSSWHSAKGNISVTEEGALDDEFGLVVTVNGTLTKSFVQSSHPGTSDSVFFPLGDEPVPGGDEENVEAGGLSAYRVGFLMDVNEVDLGEGALLEVLRIFDTDLANLVQLYLFEKSPGVYKLEAKVLENSGEARVVGQLSVGSLESSEIGVEWIAKDDEEAADGVLRILRNGKLKLEVTGLETSGMKVSALRLGLPFGSESLVGEGGKMYFDAFESYSFMSGELAD